MSDDMIGDAVGMAATGVGLGILTMGAMVPIKMMNKLADGNSGKTRKRSSKKVIKMPKMRTMKMKKIKF